MQWQPSTERHMQCAPRDAPKPMQVGQTPDVLRPRRLREEERTKPVPLHAWHLRSHTYIGTCARHASLYMMRVWDCSLAA